MKENTVLIDGIYYLPDCKRAFIEVLSSNNEVKKIQITPLINDHKVCWFQIIFETGDKRYIQSAVWGWRFLDQVPEPDDHVSQLAEEDLELAIQVGESIEAHYHIE